MKFKIVPTGTKPSILGLCDGQLLIPGDRGGVEVTEKTRFAPATEAFIAKGWVYVLPVVEAAPVPEVPADDGAAARRKEFFELDVKGCVASLLGGFTTVSMAKRHIATSTDENEIAAWTEGLRRFADLPQREIPAHITEAFEKTRQEVKEGIIGRAVAALVGGTATVADFEACIANSTDPHEVENAREVLRRFAALPPAPPAAPVAPDAPTGRRGRKAKAAGELVAPDAPTGEPDATPAEPNAPSLADATVSGP